MTEQGGGGRGAGEIPSVNTSTSVASNQRGKSQCNVWINQHSFGPSILV